jgi:hypothetical protein
MKLPKERFPKTERALIPMALPWSISFQWHSYGASCTFYSISF